MLVEEFPSSISRPIKMTVCGRAASSGRAIGFQAGKRWGEHLHAHPPTDVAGLLQLVCTLEQVQPEQALGALPRVDELLHQLAVLLASSSRERFAFAQAAPAVQQGFSVQRSGAGVEPTQPWVTRPHRF